jgi:ABC-type nitrate/sulfonate/bicarbonate transport system ATPase subunit
VIVFVTHDVDEAIKMADWIAIARRDPRPVRHPDAWRRRRRIRRPSERIAPEAALAPGSHYRPASHRARR